MYQTPTHQQHRQLCLVEDAACLEHVGHEGLGVDAAWGVHHVQHHRGERGGKELSHDCTGGTPREDLDLCGGEGSSVQESKSPRDRVRCQRSLCQSGPSGLMIEDLCPNCDALRLWHEANNWVAIVPEADHLQSSMHKRGVRGWGGQLTRKQRKKWSESEGWSWVSCAFVPAHTQSMV